MGNGLAAFAAGLGNGYMDARDRAEQERRIEEDRTIRREEIDARRAAARREQQNAIRLADAARPASVNDNGATMSLADGTQTVYDMPNGSDVAGSDFRQLRRADEATGQQTLSRATLADARMPAGSQTEASQPTMGLADMQVARPPQRAAIVNGRAFQDTGAARQAADAYNSDDATDKRVSLAMQLNGDPLAAKKYQSEATAGQLNTMKLTDARTKQLDDQINRMIDESVQANGGDVFKGLTDIATKSNVGGLKNMKMEAVPSQDGKSVQFVATGPDGSQRLGKTYSNDARGQLEARQDALRADPTTKVKMLHERFVEGQKQSNFESTLSETKQHNRATETNAAITAGAAATKASGDNTKPPPGYRKTASGNLEAIPGGPADLKLQGSFNQDTAALNGATSSFDRLATAANEVLNHPGLNGITGWRGKVPNVPGGDAANAEALLTTLKSQVGFGVLQDMRNQSKTGGALGAVSEKELLMLQSNLAALEKAQSVEQYRTQLKKIIDYSEQAKERMRQSFNMRHPSAGERGASAAPEGVLKVTSPADAMKLPSGTVFVDANGVTRRRP